VKNDVTFLAIMVAFFALSALFVVACDRLIGPDVDALGEMDESPEPAAAPTDLAA
jgi:hypothetical protein